MLRGHHANDDVGGFERAVQIAGRFDRLGQGEAGQETLVDSAARDALRNLRLFGPEADLALALVRTLASKNHGQSVPHALRR